jgi:hypothetical protein
MIIKYEEGEKEKTRRPQSSWQLVNVTVKKLVNV